MVPRGWIPDLSLLATSLKLSPHAEKLPRAHQCSPVSPSILRGKKKKREQKSVDGELEREDI